MRSVLLIGFAALLLGACSHTRTERERVVVEPQRSNTVVVPAPQDPPGRSRDTTVIVPPR